MKGRLAGLGIVLAAVVSGAADASEPLSVFAAASTREPVNRVLSLCRPGACRAVFAATSSLARQIEAGAPADLFLAANVQWMDYLQRAGWVAGRRTKLLGNTLVVVGPPGTAPGLGGLAALVAGNRLAMADPDHVPAGIYGRAALRHLGLWPALAPQVVRMPNVRAALAMVARREAIAGIVYGTDLALVPELDLVATFPAASHAPIVYPLAIVSAAPAPPVERFWQMFRSPEAQTIFSDFGFRILDAGP